MSARSQEADRSDYRRGAWEEAQTGYRLADLEKLKASPIVALAHERATALIGEGKSAMVGITTEEAVREGSDPMISILFDLVYSGEPFNPQDPEGWDYSRVDLIGSSIGDNPLKVTVQGGRKNYESPLPHYATDKWIIGSALDDAFKNPMTGGHEITPQTRNFPIPGFEKLPPPEMG